MQAYGPLLARIYDRRWSAFAARAAAAILAFYESARPGRAPGALLDVCCGTGQLALFFLERGWRVVGLDASEWMLGHARRHAAAHVAAGRARFVPGDAATFCLEERFDLAVSTFDSLNHLADEKELAGCFRSVHRALGDGGLFVFDLNTRLGLRRWDGVTLADSDEEWSVTHRGFYDEAARRGGSRITGIVARPDGSRERFEETVVNAIFDLGRVERLLGATGWSGVRFARLDDLAAPLAQPESEGRVFVVAAKEGNS